jgi:hypothetical protein
VPQNGLDSVERRTRVSPYRFPLGNEPRLFGRVAGNLVTVTTELSVPFSDLPDALFERTS